MKAKKSSDDSQQVTFDFKEYDQDKSLVPVIVALFLLRYLNHL